MNINFGQFPQTLIPSQADIPVEEEATVLLEAENPAKRVKINEAPLVLNEMHHTTIFEEIAQAIIRELGQTTVNEFAFANLLNQIPLSPKGEAVFPEAILIDLLTSIITFQHPTALLVYQKLATITHLHIASSHPINVSPLFVNACRNLKELTIKNVSINCRAIALPFLSSFNLSFDEKFAGAQFNVTDILHLTCLSQIKIKGLFLGEALTLSNFAHLQDLEIDWRGHSPKELCDNLFPKFDQKLKRLAIHAGDTFDMQGLQEVSLPDEFALSLDTFEFFGNGSSLLPFDFLLYLGTTLNRLILKNCIALGFINPMLLVRDKTVLFEEVGFQEPEMFLSLAQKTLKFDVKDNSDGTFSFWKKPYHEERLEFARLDSTIKKYKLKKRTQKPSNDT